MVRSKRSSTVRNIKNSLLKDLETIDFSNSKNLSVLVKKIRSFFKSRPEKTIKADLQALFSLLKFKFTAAGWEWICNRWEQAETDPNYTRSVSAVNPYIFRSERDWIESLTETYYAERENVFITLDESRLEDPDYIRSVKMPVLSWRENQFEIRKRVEKRKRGEHVEPSLGSFKKRGAFLGTLERKLKFIRFLGARYRMLREEGLNPNLNFWKERFTKVTGYFVHNYFQYKQTREEIKKRGKQLEGETGYYYTEDNKFVYSILYSSLPVKVLEEYALIPLNLSQMRFLSYLSYLTKLNRFTREYVHLGTNFLMERKIFHTSDKKAREISELIARGIIEEYPIFRKGVFPKLYRFAPSYLEQLKQKQTFSYPLVWKEKVFSVEDFKKRLQREQEQIEKETQKELPLGKANDIFLQLLEKVARRKYRQMAFQTATDCTLAEKIYLPDSLVENLISAHNGEPLLPEILKFLPATSTENARYLLVRPYLWDIPVLQQIFEWVKAQSQGSLFSLKYIGNFPKPSKRKFKKGEIKNHEIQEISQEISEKEERFIYESEVLGLGEEEQDFYQEIRQEFQTLDLEQREELEKRFSNFSPKEKNLPEALKIFFSESLDPNLDQEIPEISEQRKKEILKENQKIFEKQDLICRAKKDFSLKKNTTNKFATIEKYIYGYNPALAYYTEQISEKLRNLVTQKDPQLFQKIKDPEILTHPIKLKVWQFYQKHVTFDLDACIEENKEFFNIDKNRFAVLSYIRQIISKNPRITVGEKSGRVYHPLVNMPKRFRKYARIDGQPVQEIDISNCHPTLMLSLFTMRELQLQNVLSLIDFKKKGLGPGDTDYSLWSFKEQETKWNINQTREDRNQFKEDLLQRDFYSQFVTPKFDRKTIKIAFEVSLVLSPLWRRIWLTKNPNNSDTKTALTERIRRALETNITLGNLLHTLWKQRKPVQCLLQQIESIIVLEGAYLAEKQPEFLPMHDGAIFAYGNERAAQRFQELVRESAKSLYHLEEIQFSIK